MIPSAPMAYQLARLRSGVADPELFDDPTVTRFLSDGYVAACERSRLLHAWTTIPLVIGFQEYALPADWLQTIRVYMLGEAMDELSTRIAPRGDAGFYYYSYGGVIGMVSTPTTSGGSLTLHYARSPVALGIADTPERQFGAEWYHLMRHYAAWHILRLGYGEEKIGEANRQRLMFEQGVAQLQRYAGSRAEAWSNATPVTHIISIAQSQQRAATAGTP